MKRLGVTVALGAIAFAVFVYVQPLLTIRALAGALERSDGEAIRERMDAERTRQSLREGYIARLTREPDDSDRGVAIIASLTMFGKGIEMIIATSRDESSAEVANWGYDTTTRFRAELQQEAAAPITLVLDRTGLGWQVVAMEPSEEAWRELGPILGEP